MRVLVTGGGTAGHVTPLVALAAEVRAQSLDASVVMIGFKGDRKLLDTVVDDDDFSRLYTITAGKFRRYYGVPLWRQLLDIPTVVNNVRDLFRTIRGTFAAVRIIRRERPNVIFAKGGFVSVPVSIAAKVTNTALVTHDSDTIPGLANRITARWATTIATGAPARYYSYPEEKVVEVGVPVDSDVLEVKDTPRAELLKKVQLSSKLPVITVSGGTHGGKQVNEAVLAVLPQLLKQAQVVHIAGSSNYQAVQKHFADHQMPERYRLEKIVGHEQLMQYFAVSDVVVTRVGASTMAELAILGACAVLVPNPKLTGGHQTKNAKRFDEEGAAVVLTQDALVKKPELLLNTVADLLADAKKRKKLSKKLQKLAKPKATKQLAEILISIGGRGQGSR